jgi:hypothetical protein
MNRIAAGSVACGMGSVSLFATSPASVGVPEYFCAVCVELLQSGAVHKLKLYPVSGSENASIEHGHGSADGEQQGPLPTSRVFSCRDCECFVAAYKRGLADQVLERLQPPLPVAYILTIASCDGLVQQPNGIITREVEATHCLRRRIIVTSGNCIAVETDAILVLVHRSSNPFPGRHHSQQKQQGDTSRPHARYGDRHHSGGRFFSIEAHRFLLYPI